jgi:hypothetical protein
MLHETNRRDVITNLLVWISSVLKKVILIRPRALGARR